MEKIKFRFTPFNLEIIIKNHIYLKKNFNFTNIL
jgi:hypothetical protein